MDTASTIEALAIIVAAVPLAVAVLVAAAELQWRRLESNYRRDRDDAVLRGGRRLLPQLRIIERLDSVIKRRRPRGPGGTGPVGTSVHCYLGLASFHGGQVEDAVTHLGIALRSPDRSVTKVAWVESSRPTYWLALRSLGRLHEVAADFDIPFDPQVPLTTEERVVLHLLAGTHFVVEEDRGAGRHHYEALIEEPGWADVELPGVIAAWFWLINDEIDHGELAVAQTRLAAGRALAPVAATRFPDLLDAQLAAERADVDGCFEHADRVETVWLTDDEPRTRFATTSCRLLALRNAGRTAEALAEAERLAALVEAEHTRIGILSPTVALVGLADAQFDAEQVEAARRSLAAAEEHLGQLAGPLGERNLVRLDLVRSCRAEADGDLLGALGLATAARDRCARNNFALDLAAASLRLAELTWSQGDVDGAVALASTARQQLAERAGPVRVAAVERRHPELFPAAP